MKKIIIVPIMALLLSSCDVGLMPQTLKVLVGGYVYEAENTCPVRVKKGDTVILQIGSSFNVHTGSTTRFYNMPCVHDTSGNIKALVLSTD